MAFDISKLDEKLDLTSGEWIDNIDDNPGLKLKVRSQRYKFFKSAFDRVNRKAGKNGVSDKEFGELLADYILVDWDFQDADGPLVLTDNGRPVPYSPEIAKKVLTAEDDRGIGSAWRLAVVAASNIITERNLTSMEGAAKN